MNNQNELAEIRRKNLKKWIDKNHNGIQRGFMDATNISQSDLSGLLKPYKPFGEKRARRLEKLAGMPENYLDQCEYTTAEPKKHYITTASQPCILTRIPVRGNAQLGDNGHWSEIDKLDGDGFVKFTSKDKSAYAVRCVGDSMMPRIRPGEFVIVEPNAQLIPNEEALISAKDGRVMVKIFLFKTETEVGLASVNESHPIITMPLAEIQTIHYVSGIAKRPLFEDY